jgi:Fur family peroxide stress response transcriptional regulator
MDKNNIISELKHHGVKPTLHRVGLLEILSDMMTHPTAEEIFEQVKIKYPTISLATVYNTLEIFTKESIIYPIKFDNSATRYDFVHHPHFHLIENETKEIIDYCDDKLSGLLNEYFVEKEIDGYEIRNIKLEIIVNKK